MPRNTPTTPESFPSDEPSNHRKQSTRLPRNRAGQENVAEMPRSTDWRGAHPDTRTDSSGELDSEIPEAPRGRFAERGTSDGERLDTNSGSPPEVHRRQFYPEDLFEDPVAASSGAQTGFGLHRELPWFGCSLIYIEQLTDKR